MVNLCVGVFVLFVVAGAAKQHSRSAITIISLVYYVATIKPSIGNPINDCYPIRARVFIQPSSNLKLNE